MKITEYWIQGDQRPTLTMMSGEWLGTISFGPDYMALNKGKLTLVGTTDITADRRKYTLRRV